MNNLEKIKRESNKKTCGVICPRQEKKCKTKYGFGFNRASLLDFGVIEKEPKYCISTEDGAEIMDAWNVKGRKPLSPEELDEVVLKNRKLTPEYMMKIKYGARLSVALPSGIMIGRAYELFARAGLRSRDFEEKFDDKTYEYQGPEAVFNVTKPSDVPQAIDGGYDDFGICGFDSKREYELSNITPSGAMAGRGFVSDFIPDLGLCNMTFKVCGLPENKKKFAERLKNGLPIVVATAYPAIAMDYLSKKYPNARFDIRTLNGKVESAPARYGDDAIFEIVGTGAALEANRLEVYSNAMDNPTRLLLSRVAIRKDPRIMQVAEKIKEQVLS
ncbi:MAG: ATP phosphoribosyltransferase [Firmicutes bacterium]|nr:ATP phosphoribosyltransferase [Bacillota bacterium]